MTQLSSYSSFSVDSSLSAAKILMSKAPDTLSGTAKLLYRALVATAIETAKQRGYSPGVSHVTVFLPLEVLAFVCGMHRVTAWRNLPALREVGLVDYRALKGTLRGESRNSGCLFAVRLTPDYGSKAKLTFEELKHKGWRDLQRDVYAKRTAHRQLKSALQLSDKNSTGLDIGLLLEWSLAPSKTQNPLQASDGCTPKKVSLEALLDVKSAAKEERNQMVELAAQALATALADAGSVNWYQKLLWQLLRRFDATGDDYSYQVYLMAQRAKTDALEGFARRSGALFHSRLRRAEWFDEVMRMPPNRVGTKPN